MDAGRGKKCCDYLLLVFEPSIFLCKFAFDADLSELLLSYEPKGICKCCIIILNFESFFKASQKMEESNKEEPERKNQNKRQTKQLSKLEYIVYYSQDCHFNTYHLKNSSRFFTCHANCKIINSFLSVQYTYQIQLVRRSLPTFHSPIFISSKGLTFIVNRNLT